MKSENKIQFTRFAVLMLIAAAALTFIAGCSAPAEISYESLSSERLINKLEANRRKIRSMEGTGTFSVKTPSFENSASFRIVVQKPDSIYISISGPFGIDLAQILVTNKNFVFLESLNNTAYTGKISDNILKEIFKIDLPLTDLIDAFTGSANLSSRLYKEPSYFDIVQDKYILTYIDSVRSTATRYSVDVKDLSIVASKHETLAGKALLESSFTDFTILEALSIPKKISLKRIGTGESVDIEYKSISVNKKNSFIDFKIPEDADIISW